MGEHDGCQRCEEEDLRKVYVVRQRQTTHQKPRASLSLFDSFEHRSWVWHDSEKGLQLLYLHCALEKTHETADGLQRKKMREGKKKSELTSPTTPPSCAGTGLDGPPVGEGFRSLAAASSLSPPW
jgi:hypothetical protein